MCGVARQKVNGPSVQTRSLHSCSARIKRINTLGENYAYSNVFYNGYKRTDLLWFTLGWLLFFALK